MINQLIVFIVKIYLRLKGVRYGASLKASGIPKIIRSKDSVIILGDNVLIRKNSELRATNGSTLEIGSHTSIDTGVRVIAGNNGIVSIGNNVKLGFYSVLNGGGGIEIGDDTSLYGFVYIQTSTHLDRGHLSVDGADQKYMHKKVKIGSNTIIGAHCSLIPGVEVGSNVTIGANAVVTKNIGHHTFVYGVPAK